MNVEKSPEAYRAEQQREAELRARRREAARQAALRQVQARQLLELHRRHEAEEGWPPLALYDQAIRQSEPVWYLRGREGALP